MFIGNIHWKKFLFGNITLIWTHGFDIGNGIGKIGNKLDWKHKIRLETFVLDWKQKRTLETIFLDWKQNA